MSKTAYFCSGIWKFVCFWGVFFFLIQENVRDKNRNFPSRSMSGPAFIPFSKAASPPQERHENLFIMIFKMKLLFCISHIWNLTQPAEKKQRRGETHWDEENIVSSTDQIHTTQAKPLHDYSDPWWHTCLCRTIINLRGCLSTMHYN